MSAVYIQTAESFLNSELSEDILYIKIYILILVHMKQTALKSIHLHFAIICFS